MKHHAIYRRCQRITHESIHWSIERGESLQAVEIKSGEMLNDHLFDGLRWFSAQTGLPPAQCTLVYGGDEAQTRAAGRVLPWKQAHTLAAESA